MMRNLHKKPKDASPSNLLAEFAEEIALNAKGIIIDVACGFGRNAICLASYGVPVICIDNDINALNFIETGLDSATTGMPPPRLLSTLRLDLENEPWPFGDETVGAIINVHFFVPKILGCFTKSLKIGGYLFIETIDGRGGNYLELPPQGFIKEGLGDCFEIKHFKEKKVGPIHSNACTSRLLAIKRKSI